ncbi:MAG: hypothetical protein ICV74_06880 [Thermoleophilia bacterium]|nr:hypothetical protein [Thermoleophilia bacterium]
MPDAIRLTIPYARSYAGVIRLVVGGLAARLDLPYESLEDVQLALETLLANGSYAASEAVTVEIEVADGVLGVSMGPLARRELEADLARDPEGEGVGLGRLLTTVMGGYELDRREGAEWVRMRKRLRDGAGA